MSEMFSIGLSGLNLARTQLTTTAHNQANVYTPGYSRQSAEFATAPAVGTTSGFMGTGVRVLTVARSYDQFINDQLTQADAGAAGLDTQSTQMGRLDNLLADQTSGLSALMQTFFAGVQGVEGRPERAPRCPDPITAPLQDFNAFNLMLADSGEAHFLSNRPHDIRTRLAHGIYGLSNGALDEPWPKTLQLKGALLDWLNRAENRAGDDFGPLFAALRNEHLVDVGLPPREPSDVPREASETPAFIRDRVYGTRCSTVVAIGRDGRGMITERRFSPNGESTGETTLAFDWPE